MAPLRRTHGRPPGMSSRCQPSATPSLRSVECSGARQNYRCPGQAKRPSKFPLLYCSAWSTPSATPPDATHFGPFGEMLNRSAQIMAGGKSSSGDLYFTEAHRRQMRDILSDVPYAVHILDMSNEPPILRDTLSNERTLQLREILDRIPLPDPADVPD